MSDLLSQHLGLVVESSFDRHIDPVGEPQTGDQSGSVLFLLHLHKLFFPLQLES